MHFEILNLSKIPKGSSLWKNGMRRFFKNRVAIAGCVFLGVLAILSLCAPLIAPFSFEAQDLSLGAVGPNATHWLGTDILGRDLFTRILYGGRISLLVGLCATGVSVLIGVTYGAIAGYRGGLLDTVMMRFVDVMYAFPFTIFVIILMVFFDRSLILLFVAIGAVEWLTMARIVRGQCVLHCKTGIHRGRRHHGPSEETHYFQSYRAQYFRAGDRVHHAYYSGGHAFGGVFKLPGARRAASGKLVGAAYQGRGGIHGRISVVACFPGTYSFGDAFFP